MSVLDSRWLAHAALLPALILVAACSKPVEPSEPVEDDPVELAETSSERLEPDSKAEPDEPSSSNPEPVPPPEPKPKVIKRPPVPPPPPVTPVAESKSAPKAAAEPEVVTAGTVAIERGMSYAEVREEIGMDGAEVTSDGKKNGVVRWQLTDGSNIQARFTDGLLERFVVNEAAKASTDGEEEPQGVALTEAQYDQILEGMSIYQVTEYLDMEGTRISGSEDTAIYRWRSDDGASFSARFEHGKLVRKSSLQTPVVVAESTEGEREGEGNPNDDDDGQMAEQDVGVEGEPGDWEGEEEEERGRLVFTRRGVFEADSAADARAQADDADGAQAPRVSRVGGQVVEANRNENQPPASQRGQVEADRRDRRRRAKLPDYRHSLDRGVYEVRIINETGSSAQVGIRKGDRGRDAQVGAYGQSSLYVNRGTYSFFYINRDQPYDLQKGSSIRLDGQFVADMEVRLNEDGFSVLQLEQPIFY